MWGGGGVCGFWGVMRHAENLPDRHAGKKLRFVVFGQKRSLQIIWHDVMDPNMQNVLFLDVFNQAKNIPQKKISRFPYGRILLSG